MVISGLIVGEQRVLVNRSMWRDYVDVHHFTRCGRSNAAKFGTHKFSLRLFIIKLIILILTLCSILRPQQLIIILLLHEYTLLNIGHLGVLLRQIDFRNRKGKPRFATFAVLFSILISPILFILQSLMLSLLNFSR